MASTEDLAKLSLEVYDGSVSYGWTFLEEPTAAQKATGLYAVAYRNIFTGEIVIAYKGTTVTDSGDLGADIALTVSGEHAQFVAALEFAHQINSTYGEQPGVTISVTGHSLGGGLAQLAADVFGWGGVTFDAPGMDQLTEGTAAHQFDAFFALTGESFGDIPSNPVDPGNPGALGFSNLTIAGSAISSVGTHIGHKVPVQVQNGTVNVIELMAAWTISGGVAVPMLMMALNQLDLHSMENIYTRLRDQSEQGLLLDRMMEQFLVNGVAAYSAPDRNVWSFFESLFDGIPPLTQNQARSVITEMDGLLTTPLFDDNHTEARADLLRAQDRLKMAVQTITVSPPLDMSQWTEASEGPQALTFTVSITEQLSLTNQIIVVSFPDNAFDGSGFDLNMDFRISGAVSRFDNDGVFDHFEIVIAPGQTSAVLTLTALSDEDLDDETIGRLQFTPLYRTDTEGEVTRTIEGLVIEDAGAGNDPQYDRHIDGDLAPVDQNNEQPGVQTQIDDLGNIITDPGQAEPDREDVLYDSDGTDRIRAWGGDDRIDAARGGDDRLEGGEGDDVMEGGSGGDVITGNAGQDILFGEADEDRIFADDQIGLETARTAGEMQAGNGQRGDWLDGGAEDDILVGGAGNDAVLGGAGADTLIGGGGDDNIMGDQGGTYVGSDWDITRTTEQYPTITYYTRTYVNASVTHSGAGGADLIFGGAGEDWLFGQLGDDIIHGGADGDVIFGEEGSDVLLGEDGADQIYGDGVGIVESDKGNDYLSGGAGDDLLHGDGGNDTLAGGENADLLMGGNGDDVLIGGDGDDYRLGAWGGVGAAGSAGLIGGRGNDLLYGGTGNDLLNGDGTDIPVNQHGADILYGESGDDYLVGGGGNDMLDGDLGADELHGEDGNDVLLGGEGDDVLYGGAGADVLDGGLGNDLLYRDEYDIVKWRSGDGSDTVHGTSGQLLLENLSANAIGIQQYTDAEGSQYLGLVAGESVLWVAHGFLDTGTTYTFMDGARDQAMLMQLAPSVSLRGTEAGDTMYGSNQNDSLVSYIGSDIDYDGDDALYGQGGADHIESGMGNDRLNGGAGADTLIGGAGNDIYVVDELGDSVIENSGEGTDTVETTIEYTAPDNIENVALLESAAIDAAGNSLNNRLFGNASENTLQGLDGNDILLGRAGSDVLDGGSGADQLYGEDGNDRLEGGAQSDTLYGGAGEDVFVAALGSGTDVVVDIEGVNVIEFGAGIVRDSLDFTQYQGDDGAYYLRIAYGTGGDVIAVKNGLSGIVQSYRFADGQNISHEDLVGQSAVPALIEGTVRNDVINGSGLVDRIEGGAGDDQLFGAAGDDALLGGQGADTLNGGADNDTLDGGLGNDTLLGGVGADRYVLQWGMGSDLIIEDGAELSTLELGAGVQLADLEIIRDLDDLVVRFSGSDQGVRIQGYRTAPQNWRIQDEFGATLSLDGLVTEPSSSGTPLNFDVVSARFTRGVRANFINTLTSPGQSTGYTMGADGVIRKTTSSVTSSYVGTSYYSARFQVENVTTDDASFVQSTPAFDSQYSNTSTTVYKTNYTAVAGGYGGIAGSYGSGSRRYYSLGENAGIEIPQGAGVVLVYGQTQDQDGGQSLAADGYTGTIGTSQPVGVWVFDSNSGTGITTTVTHYTSHRDATLTVENVTGGSGNNNFTVTGNAVVDAGDGDDLVVATAQRWDSSFGNHLVPDQYSYYGQFDSRDIGALLYGNNGSDSLVGGGANDLLIGGNGEDYLDGRLGEDTYVVRRGEAGYDVIADSGMFIRILGEWPISRYSEWYYQSIGIPSYMDRLADDEPIPGLPALSPNDFAAMQQLAQSDVIETDTVEFSAGISLDQLTFGWGELVLNSPVSLGQPWDEPWMGDLGTLFRTLDISWAVGEGVRIVIPHTFVSQPLLPPDPDEEPSGFGSLDPFVRSDEYLGLGIEQFRFADGTTLSMADMVALSPPAPSFDPHLQDPDMTLTGAAGDDILAGGNGNDTLDGLEGMDQMFGDAGDDVYYVDNPGDVVSEGVDAGTDTVNSLISYALTTNVEHLTLTGADAIDGTGNTLSNILTGNDAANVLSGDAGDDTLRGMAGNDILNGGTGNDVLETGYGFDYAYGGAGNDTITGGDNLSGGWLPEYLYGEDGDDLIQGGGKYAHLFGGAGNDDLRGGAGYQNLYGEDGDDTLTAGTGYSSLNGGAGADRMIGNAASNNYWVDNLGDVIVEVAEGGADTVNSSISYVLGADLENLQLLGTEAISGAGNAGNNMLSGTGNAAANVLAGGLGDDTYYVDALDSIVEQAGEGVDTVSVAFTYMLGDNLDNLILSGNTAINGTGNDLDNRVTGNNYNNILSGGAGNDYLNGMSGNDTVNGGAGADEMLGGDGNDSYTVDDAGDIVTELSGQGTDTVNSAISYTLGANVERLTLTGTAIIDGIGNTLSNILTGNDAANVLSGDAGNDTLRGMVGDDMLYGGAGDDVIETGHGFDYAYGGAGNDTITGGDNLQGGWLPEYLYGEDGNDLIQGGGKYAHLYGGSGNDDLRAGSGYQNLYGEEGDDTLTAGTGYSQLNGGVGADRMIGNALSNNYWVDNVGDVIVEGADGGADMVYSSISYALGENLENLMLTGTEAISGTGNAGNNTLNGSQNTAANVLAGGLGDDTYVIGAGDVIIEQAGEGTDSVYVDTSYTLGDNLENLTLTGGAVINGTGNALDNRLVGNNANNVLTGGAGNDYLSGMYGNDILNGGAGADEMVGGYGNDTYYVDDAGDVVTESSGQGTDTVNSAISYTLGANVERLTLTGAAGTGAVGNTLANLLTGNAASNLLVGDAGNDTLRGMGGNDWLLGGTGNDGLEGGDGDDTLAGGAGTDTLTGGWGSDQYVFVRGDGQDLIVDYDARDADPASYGTMTDAVQLGADITHEQLWFSRMGNDLQVQVIGTNERISVQNWYLGEAYRTEEFRAGDGYVLLDTQVEQLVQAMTAFAPPVAGELTLPDSYRQDLEPVIAASWQTAA